MKREILDEVAYLFVEQFDDFYGMLTDRTDVRRIRASTEGGEEALFATVSGIFGNRLEEAFLGAAHIAMGYIAYVDETWADGTITDPVKTLNRQVLHLDSLKVLCHMARRHQLSVAERVYAIREEAEAHYRYLEGYRRR